MTTYGRGYTFAYHIFTDNSHENWQKITTIYKGNRIDIYPPFRSAPLNRNLYPDFDFASSGAFISRSIRVDRKFPKISMYPTLEFDSEGKTGLMFYTDNKKKDDKLPAFPCDSIHFDVETEDESTASAASSVSKFALRNLRRYTAQWWIGRVNLFSAGSSNIVFKVDKNYQLLAEPWIGSAARTESPHVRKIDEAIWRSAWLDNIIDDTPNSFDLYMDALFQESGGDLAMSVLSMSISCEMLKSELYQSMFEMGLISKTCLKIALKANHDLDRYFEDFLFENTSRRFSETGQNNIENIRTIWKARGIISHGKQNSAYGTALLSDITRNNNIKELNESILQLFRFCSALTGNSLKIPFSAYGFK